MQTREHSEQSTMAIGLVTSFIFDPSYENYFQLSLHLEILKKNSEAILKYLSSPMFSESVAPLIQHIKVLMLFALTTDANREQNANESIELLCKLLQSDPNNSLLWGSLSCMPTKLDSLTQSMQEKLFTLTNQHKQTPMQFKAFCCGQAIACNEKFAPAWNNLGIAFAKGASLADLPQAYRDTHFQGKDHWNAMQLLAFCSGQAIVYDEKYASAWNSLGIAFAKGASLADLPQACRDTHFQGKDNWNAWQLKAFCSGQAIVYDEKNSLAWSSLGIAFKKGARLADLPQACREQHFKEKDNWNAWQLQAFCSGQAIVYDEKNSIAWNNLGLAFSKGARLADLPLECFNKYFKGKENWNAMQLQAFCDEKFKALEAASKPSSSAKGSAATSSSATSNHKRKSDETLENPSKKKKTTHNKPLLTTRPTISHATSASSTSNTASSSSMSRTIPLVANSSSNPHAFYQTYQNPALHPFQQQHPNALNTHSHAINSGHGYPLPPTRPQPLPPFAMPQQHAGFFQRINSPTQHPQPEVQITGNGQIPPLDNLANQATLLPSLAKIKEEPAETQTGIPDSQPHGNHSKKM